MKRAGDGAEAELRGEVQVGYMNGLYLGDDFFDGAGAFDTDEFFIEACVEEGKVVGVKAELLKNGGVQVLDLERAFDCGSTELIGLADADASFDAAAGHPHGEAVGVVIAPRALGVFRGGLAAKFATPDDECFIKQATLLEILE